MTPGHAYQFRIRRKGTSKLVTYHGRFVGQVDDVLVFENLDVAGGMLRVFEDRMEGEPMELRLEEVEDGS